MQKNYEIQKFLIDYLENRQNRMCRHKDSDLSPEMTVDSNSKSKTVAISGKFAFMYGKIMLE